VFVRDDASVPEPITPQPEKAGPSEESRPSAAPSDGGARKPAPRSWPELQAGVVEWLITNWGQDHPCPYCPSTDWLVGPVIALPEMPGWPNPEKRPLGAFPMVQVVCSRCGHTVLINALWIFEPQNLIPPGRLL
jgi:hypothetical protein